MWLFVVATVDLITIPRFKFHVILSVDMYFGATVVLRRVELSLFGNTMTMNIVDRVPRVHHVW